MEQQKVHSHVKNYKLNNNANKLVSATRPSSSEVIKAAKQWALQKSIQTKRPLTPQAPRSLYGSTRKDSGSRPPSAFSLGPQSYDPSDAVVNAKPIIKSKLAPLNHTPNVPAENDISFNANSSPKISTKYSPQHMQQQSGRRRLPLKTHSAPVFSPAPVKAIHNNTAGSSRHGTLGEHGASVRYHPTPPPMRPKSQKETSKTANALSSASSQKKIVIPHAPSSESIASTNSSAGSSSATSNDGETKDEALYWNQTVLPYIEQLQDFHSERNTSKLCKSCDLLYIALQKGQCFERMSSRRRTSLLTVLFRLLKSGSSELDLVCARIILESGVRNKNLSNVCKLILQISRDKKLDDLFVKYNMIVPILHVLQDTNDPLSKYENYEAFLYLNGALKFLSDNKNVASTIYINDCISVLLQFIKTTLNALEVADDRKRAHKYAESIFVQACLTFRNLMNMDYKVQQAVSAVPILAIIIREFRADQELTWIIARIFSKLTMYNNSTSHFLAEHDWPDLFLTTIERYADRPEVVVHLTLSLGDLTAHSDQARRELFDGKGFKTDSGGRLSTISRCIDEMLQIIDSYSQGTSFGQQGEDVLVKTVRVIAHLSMEGNVGSVLASDLVCVEKLLHILETHTVEENEELMMNVLTALNNLSYYDNGLISQETGEPVSNAVSSNRLKLVSLLLNLLLVDNMACVGEVARVFGNLTKHKDVRDLVNTHKVDLMMVALLDSGDRAVVYNACGVLVNVSAEKDNRAGLIKEGVVGKLVDVLQDFAPTEWRIGGVSCQLLWNLSTDSSFSATDDLIKTLESLQDYDFVSNRVEEIAPDDDETRDYLIATWKEEFCEYSNSLLAKLKAATCNLIPLDRVVESDISSNEST